MELDHPSELLLSILAKEQGREAFRFDISEAQGIPGFLSEFRTLIREGFIGVEKPDEFGVVYFRVSEDGHQKVAEFMEAIWSECLPLMEESVRKYNK